MNAVFKEYLEKRLTPSVRPLIPVKTLPGPVVTISREYGCPAKKLAVMLTSALNKIGAQNGSAQWYWVGKEIMEQSAKELHLKAQLVNKIVSAEETGIIEDILLTFSNKYYPGDLKIKKTIGEIIKVYAATGRVVIVGRGGVSICRNIKNSFHIKLAAPLQWRINDVSRKQNISLGEAEKKIKLIDHKRELLREHFAGKRQDDTVFDVIYNYMTCSEHEILRSALKIMEFREMI